MANYSYNFPDQVNVQGFGITFEATNKAPLELNRIFETLAKANEYIHDTADKAIPGIVLSVIKDGANNGVYNIIEKSGEPNGLALVKLGSAGDIPTVNVSDIKGDNTYVNVTSGEGGVYEVSIIESGITNLVNEYLDENDYTTSGDVVNIINGTSIFDLQDSDNLVTAATITSGTEYKAVINNHSLDLTVKEQDLSEYTTSGDVENIVEQMLSGSSAHTTIQEGTNVKVTYDKPTNNYIINVPDSAITNVAKSSVKIVNGTNTTVTEGTEGDSKTFAVNVDLSDYATTASTANYITSGSAEYGTTLSMVKDGQNLKLTLPQNETPHVYTGDEKYIHIDNKDVISLIESELVDAIKASGHSYTGDDYITVNNTNDTISLDATKLPKSVSAASASYQDGTPTGKIENGEVKITFPEVKTITGTFVTAATDGKYHLDLTTNNTKLEFKYPEVDAAYAAEKQTVAWDKKVNLSANTTDKKYVLDYPDFQAVTPQTDFGSTQDKYGKITTGVTEYPAANGEIGKAVYAIEKSISGTQQVIIDDEQIFEKGIENLASAAGLIKDNIIQYYQYREIATCIKDATSLYTADVEMAKEIRNLWIAFNDIKDKLGI